MPADGKVDGLLIRTLDDARVIEKLRVLDKVCFPVTYFDKYYNNLANSGFSPISNIAWFHEALVGSITSRLEPLEGEEGKFRCYIMTLGVLKPYRRIGIASRLLQAVMDYVATQPTIVEVSLHMQVGSDALALYKRFGFEEKEVVKDYYTDIEPADAIILRRVVTHVKPAPKKGK